MKRTKIISSVLIVAVLVVLSFNSFSQCTNKKYCNDKMGDFDYKSQSSFALLSPGDTSRTNVVLYANQTYRIFVCGATDLGDITYKIVQPERKTERKIIGVKKDTIVTYKMDPATGEFMYDDVGNMVVESRKPVQENIYETIRYTDESNVVYDSKGGKPYLDYTPKKTGKLVVKIQIPAGDPEDEDCVNVYVGRKMVGSKNFKSSSQYTDD